MCYLTHYKSYIKEAKAIPFVKRGRDCSIIKPLWTGGRPWTCSLVLITSNGHTKVAAIAPTMQKPKSPITHYYTTQHNTAKCNQNVKIGTKFETLNELKLIERDWDWDWNEKLTSRGTSTSVADDIAGGRTITRIPSSSHVETLETSCLLFLFTVPTFRYNLRN